MNHATVATGVGSKKTNYSIRRRSTKLDTIAAADAAAAVEGRTREGAEGLETESRSRSLRAARQSG